jgi:actin-like ATPase involved in cell morphogenesis
VVLAGNDFAVSIDLGTSNTVALIRWPDGRSRPVLFDGQPIMASAVYLDERGAIHTGRDAERMAQLDPARYEPNPKRRVDEGSVLLGDREIPVTDLLAAPLARVARAVLDAVGHLPPAMLTCPVAWGQARRSVLQAAAARAGWPRTQLVAEPAAAARYFTVTLGQPVPPGAVLAIFDFGGGTLDIALVRNNGGALTVVGMGGSEDLGGVDIDAALVTHLGGLLAHRHPATWAQLNAPADALDRRLRRAFWEDVRAAKEMLSRTAVAPVPVPGVDAALHLTRDELERAALPLLERAVAEFRATLNRSGLAGQSLCGVFLVGGASRVPLVSRLLHAHIGVAPTVADQPELPVAEGALIALAQPAGPPPRRAAPAPPRMPAYAASMAPVVAHPAKGAHRGSQRPHRILAVVAVVILAITGMAGGLVYYALKPRPSFHEAIVEHTITIADLAPNGLRQSLLTETKAYAIGQRADGEIEIVTFDLKAKVEVRHRPARAAGWERAELYGNWVVVTSTPAADGKRTIAFANGADNVAVSWSTGGSGDQLVVRSVGLDSPDLDVFVLAPSAGSIRTLKVDRSGVHEGTVHRLPPGAQVANRSDQEDRSLDLVDANGVLYTYTGNGDPEHDRNHGPLPAGHPRSLFFWTGVAEPWIAEDKPDYRVLNDVKFSSRGPADRRPVWLGPCGRQPKALLLDDYVMCVVDELPGQPSSRELAVYEAGRERIRAPVPNAHPGDVIVEADGYFLVPTIDGDRPGYIIVAPDRTTRGYPGRLWQTGFRAVVHLSTLTSAPEAVKVIGIDLDDNLHTEVGTPKVRSAGCATALNRLACPGSDDFTVWLVGTKAV